MIPIKTLLSFCRTNRIRPVSVAPTMALLLWASAVSGQEVGSPSTTGVISVSASGEDKVTPDLLELDFFINAGAQLGTDTATKYHDSLKRVQDSLRKADLGEMKLEDCGTTITHQPSQNAAGMTSVSKAMRLTVGGVDKLSESDLLLLAAKLIDAVKDAGATPGSNTRFTVSDHSAARRRAADGAFQAAKESAEDMASRAKVKVGRLANLEEIDNIQVFQHGSQGTAPNPQFAFQQFPHEELKLRSYTFKPLLVRVSVRAQFYLQPDDKQP
jgi:uncharacterized protein YggE